MEKPAQQKLSPESAALLEALSDKAQNYGYNRGARSGAATTDSSRRQYEEAFSNLHSRLLHLESCR